jgi:RNA polymerase sigma factor (sigma-70 family)
LKALKKEADERLLVEAAQKDPARFAELYENNFERVYAYVVRRVGDRAETEGLTSEVFHHALANLQKFEWRGIPFAAWLFRIAANLISDRWQRSSRERLVEAPEQIEPAQAKNGDLEEYGTAGNTVPFGGYVAGGTKAGNSPSLTPPDDALYNCFDPHHCRKLTRSGGHVRNPGV